MRHIPGRCAVDIAIHKVVTEELRMVKRVERLEPEFQRFRLRQPGELVNRALLTSSPDARSCPPPTPRLP
jgi:hypothetical protein